MFIEGRFNIYGAGEMVPNVHPLEHLARDAEHHGLLDNFSAFAFESYLGILKRKFKNASNLVSQLLRRYSESEFSANVVHKTARNFHVGCVCIVHGKPARLIDITRLEDVLNYVFCYYKDPSNFWEYGIASSSIFVFKTLNQLEDSTFTVGYSEITCECVCFTGSFYSTIIPLLHTFLERI